MFDARVKREVECGHLRSRVASGVLGVSRGCTALQLGGAQYVFSCRVVAVVVVVFLFLCILERSHILSSRILGSNSFCLVRVIGLSSNAHQICPFSLRRRLRQRMRGAMHHFGLPSRRQLRVLRPCRVYVKVLFCRGETKKRRARKSF